MAATLVQSTGKIQKTGTTATPEAFSFSSNATAGNTGIATFAYFEAGSAFISGVTIGGTAASLESSTTDGAGGRVEIWRAQNMAGGTTAISVASTTSSHFYSGSVEEWSGLANVAADIVATPANATSTAPSATYGTLAQADELVYIAYMNNTGGILASSTVPGSYTAAWTELDGAAQQGGAAAYRVVASTTGASPAFALSTSIAWRAVLVTLKATAAAPTINTQPASQQIPDQTRVQLSVTATTSGGALSYQWQDNRSGSFANTTDGDNATSATYTTPALYVSQSPRQYRCVVTDANGSTNSNAATITVAPRDFRPELTRKRRVVGGITQLNDIRGWWG